MMLRAEVGEIEIETAHFWTDVQKQNTDQRLESFGISKNAKSGKRRRRPRRKRSQKSRQS